MTDPFATEDGGDGLEDARTEFLGAGDLVDRVVIIEPKKLIKDLPSSKQGEFYDAIECFVHVLNGPTTETFTNLPWRGDIRLSGKGLVPMLVPSIATGTPVVGIMHKYKAAQKGWNDSHRLDKCEVGTPERAAAGKYWAVEKARRAKEAQAAAEADPFALA